MNNCRAGLYSFTPTTTWLRKIGIASPPYLVLFGLTLPDSRILGGVAGIGLTLVDIVIILPHLRQPITDSIRTHEDALARGHNTLTETDTSLNGSDVGQPVDQNTDIALASPLCDEEHQGAPLIDTATVKLICSPVMELQACLNPTEVMTSPPTTTLLPAETTDDDQTVLQTFQKPDPEFSENGLRTGDWLARDGRCATQVPLPVTDDSEIAFVDTGDTNHDVEGRYPLVASEQLVIPAEQSTRGVDDDQSADVHDGQNTVWDKIDEDLKDVVMSRPGYIAPILPEGKVYASIADDPVAPLPDDHTAREANARIAGGRSSAGGQEVPVSVQQRSESLAFIPQSVVRRYPSVSKVSASHCFAHRALRCGHAAAVPTQFPVHNPAMPTQGPRPLDGRWHASSSPATSEGCAEWPFTVGQTVVIQTHPALHAVQQGSRLGPDPTTIHRPVLRTPYATPKRRLGVLARAALRDRRSAARRWRNDDSDSSSSSESDTDSSGSDLSSGSSANESMLPHMLGADLIAAIDANSESGLNLAGRKPAPGDSAADVSMLMHVPTRDGATNGVAKPFVAPRTLTSDDIQQWASSVVQKCVPQVCRARLSAGPSSPSQASDVCVERPSGSGISQCSSSGGLHRKLGIAMLAETSASKTLKELAAPLATASAPLASTKPPVGRRNLCEIPEFVPRLRQPLVIPQGPQRHGARLATINTVTFDAATEVIARLESQVGYRSRRPPRE